MGSERIPKERKKVMKKILTLTMVMLLVALSVVPAFAAHTYTAPSENLTFNFNTRLVMDAGDTTPNVTFNYSIAPGSAISEDTSDNTVMQVLAGVGTPTIGSAVFSPATTAASNGDGLVATVPVTVNFSGVPFDEPGIYRYIVTQASDLTHTTNGFTHDAQATRVLDVYVVDEGEGLEIASYVLHTDVSDVAIGANMGSNDVENAGDSVANKSTGFTNVLATKDLKVSMGVTGNQASRNKYFAVTVQVTGITAGDSYVVSLANDSNANTNDGNADETISTNSATVFGALNNAMTVSGSDLITGKTFYLHNGQSVVIRGLSPNATYEVTENAEDYLSAVMSGKTNSGNIGTVAGSNKMAEAGFTNTRDGVIPTGVMVSVAGGVTLVATAMIALLILGRKKEEEE